MVEVIPFDPRHLREISFGPYEQSVFSLLNLDDAIAGWPPGPGFSVMDNGGIIGSGGITPQGADGVMWAAFSDELRNRPVVLLRGAVRLIREQLHNFNRLILTVPEELENGHRWATALGFCFYMTRPEFGFQGQTHLEYHKWA